MERVKPALLFLILLPVFGMAQSAKDSWDNLKQLRPGEKIEVVDTSMKSFNGRFVAVSEEAITLEADKSQESIERAKVVRVSVRDTSHRTRNILLGAGILGGAALAIGLPLSELNSNEGHSNGGVAALIAGGFGVGAGLGAISNSRTVYRVKK